MRNIIFYFPYRGIGGVSILFKRLSIRLSSFCKVFLVDFSDGFMGKNFLKDIIFIDFQTASNYPKNTTLVLQSLPPWNIKDIKKFDSNTRIFFWNLHPLNLYPFIFSIHSNNRYKVLIAKFLLPISFLRKRKICQVVEYLAKHNSIVFMDEENYNSTVKLFPGIKIPKKILPIFSLPRNLISREPKGTLRCCWIGRIVDFKVHILKHLIERLDLSVPSAGPLKLIIVGDGDSLDFLKVSISHIKALQIEFVKYIHPDKLDSFLEEKVDVLFAMGTSALEGASKGIPTYLLDFSYKPIVGNYRFRYIHLTEKFSLGKEIKFRDIENYSTLEDQLIYLRANYKKISKLTYRYWSSNFSPESVEKKFIKYLDDASATILDMKKLGFFKPDIISLLVKRLVGIFKKKSLIVHGFNED
jgi:hypothetical protein